MLVDYFRNSFSHIHLYFTTIKNSPSARAIESLDGDIGFGKHVSDVKEPTLRDGPSRCPRIQKRQRGSRRRLTRLGGCCLAPGVIDEPIEHGWRLASHHPSQLVVGLVRGQNNEWTHVLSCSLSP